MKLVLVILGLVAVCFLCMVLYLYVNQRKMLYYPQPLDRDWDHVKDNVLFEHSFERDGVQLKGWLLNPNNKRLLIYYGGNGEEASLLIDQFKYKENVATLLMNYRGYGESEGKPTEKNLVGDALAIFDALRDRYESIVIFGRSLGTGIAVQVAAARKIDQLILVTPFDSIAAVGQGLYPWAPVKLLAKDPYDSLAVSAKVNEPTLFLVSEVDYVVPRKHAQNLYDHWNGPKKWVEIPGSDHNSITEFPVYWSAINSFLAND